MALFSANRKLRPRGGPTIRPIVRGVVIKSPRGELVSSATQGHNIAAWVSEATDAAISAPHIQEGNCAVRYLPWARTGYRSGGASECIYRARHENVAFELTKGFQQRERTFQKETGPCRDRFVSAASVRARACVRACACFSVSSSGHGLTTIALWMI